jgi:hypothetical protein
MSNDETIASKREATIRALGELFSNPKMRAHVYHRYILVQRASGELVFEQEAFDFYLEQAIAKAFGQRKPRRRTIRIAPWVGEPMNSSYTGLAKQDRDCQSSCGRIRTDVRIAGGTQSRRQKIYENSIQASMSGRKIAMPAWGESK